MDLATQADLADRLGRDLTDVESRQAAAWLRSASAIIVRHFPAYATTRDDVSTSVCCEMVLRVLRNPDGKRSETVDDYSYTIDSTRSAGELYITENEMRDLAAGATSGVAFSITPTAPACTPCPP